MGINNRGAWHPSLRQHVDPTLGGFVGCTISIYDAELLKNTGQDYDWRTNTGANQAPTLLWSGDAQLQIYRFTLVMDAPAGSVDRVRTVRFTVSHEEVGDIAIRQGMRVFVDSCPEDPTLEKYQYIVNSGINAPTAFRRTIECDVEMTRVVP